MNYILSVCPGEREYAFAIIQNVVRARKHHDMPAGFEEEERDKIYLQRVYLLRSLDKGEIDYEQFTDKIRENQKNLERSGITDLLVDKTDQGDSFIEHLNDEKIYPIEFERKPSGKVVYDGSGYTVPEKDLLSSLRIVQKSSRIKWPSSLPLLEDFLEELQTQDLNVTVEKGRKMDKSLLLFSVAQAVWYLSKVYSNNVLKIGDQENSLEDYDPLRV